MKFLLNIKNYYYTFFLFFFILVGIFYSLQVGITHDEQYDLYVWQANKNVIINTFLGKNLDTSFLSGGSEFYGSGFHILSYPIENLIKFFQFYLTIMIMKQKLYYQNMRQYLFFLHFLELYLEKF